MKYEKIRQRQSFLTNVTKRRLKGVTVNAFKAKNTVLIFREGDGSVMLRGWLAGALQI